MTETTTGPNYALQSKMSDFFYDFGDRHSDVKVQPEIPKRPKKEDYNVSEEIGRESYRVDVWNYCADIMDFVMYDTDKAESITESNKEAWENYSELLIHGGWISMGAKEVNDIIEINDALREKKIHDDDIEKIIMEKLENTIEHVDSSLNDYLKVRG